MFLLPSTTLKVAKTKKKGRGVFALTDIPAGTVIGDYIGKLLAIKNTPESDDITDIWRNYTDVIRPEMKSHGIHCINHSCAPNCGFYPHKGHTLAVSLRHIFAGEELSLLYIIDPPKWNEPNEYAACCCGSAFCKGSMYATEKYAEDFWDFEQKKHGKFFSKRLTPYGTVIPTLPRYPKIIKDHPIYDLYGSESKKPLQSKASSMPKVKEIRNLIRESGRPVEFPKIGITVLGVCQGYLITK